MKYNATKYFVNISMKAVSRIFILLFIVTLFFLSKHFNEKPNCDDVLDDCEGVPFNETLLPPFQNYYHEFIVSPRYRLSHCLLPKVISTISTAIICYLDNPMSFHIANRTISTESYFERFCPQLERKSYSEVKPFLKKPSSNIIIVRNPYDRFVSGFVDKCFKKENLCHGCRSDMRCFLREEFKRLKNFAQHPVYNVSDTHFAPQTWNCEMGETLKTSTIIRYGRSETEKTKMIEDYLKMFWDNGVMEKEIEEIKKELSKGKSVNTTFGSKRREYYEKLIREDAAIRRAIQRFYYYDFKYLNFEM